jgi:hypothetical protein
MKTGYRRALGICIGVLILLIPLSLSFDIPVLKDVFMRLWEGGLALLTAVNALVPPAKPGQNLNTNDRETYESLSMLGLSIAAALSVVFFLWDRNPSKKVITISYFLFLVVLMSMSTANFASGDMLLNRKAQALIDLVLVVLGSIVLLTLSRIRPASATGVVLQAVIMFLIAFEAVVLPGLLGFLWLLNWQQVISAGASQNLNPGWISGPAAIVSAGIAFLNYRSSQKTQQKSVDTPVSPIIRP